MSKRKLTQGRKPQSDSSQSSILTYFQRNNIGQGQPRKSLKVEQEEKLLAQDPISSFSQSQTSFFNSQEGFAFSQNSFEEAHGHIFNNSNTQESDFTPFLFDIKEPNASSSQRTNTESVISEFPSEPEIGSLIQSPQFEFKGMVHSSPQFNIDKKVPEVEDLLGTSLRPSKVMKVKPNGLTDHAMKYIAKEKLEYDKWEMTINGQMAKYGSIVKVCLKQPEVYLFRMIKTWAEGGLVFSWCVLLKDEEIQFLLSNDEGSVPNTQSDSIKDFQSQRIPSLPDYIPQEDDEKILFAFSFCFTNSRVSLQNFIEHEQVVGIWPDWSEVSLELDNYGPCEVNLARRFKANSIY